MTAVTGAASSGTAAPGEPGGPAAGCATEHLLPDVDAALLLAEPRRRDAVVLVVGDDPQGRTAASLLAHSPRASVVAAADDPSALRALGEHLAGERESGPWEPGQPLPVPVAVVRAGTVVGPAWLTRLQWALASRAGAATATAMAAEVGGELLAPAPGDGEEAPFDRAARAAAQRAAPWSLPLARPAAPCVLVAAGTPSAPGGSAGTAEPPGVLEVVAGGVDAEAAHLLVPHVLVGVSAPAGAPVPATGARRRLEHETSQVQRVVRRVVAGELAPRRRVLQVLHRGGGGTPAMVADLSAALADDVETLVLEAVGGRALELSREGVEGREHLVRWAPATPFAVTDTWRQDAGEVLARLVVGLAVEVVHVHHLVNQPVATLPVVVHRLGLPLVMTAHDHYYTCPTVTLLDESQRYCGGVCTPGDAAPGCIPDIAFARSVPTLKHRWVHVWQERCGEVLELADAVVVPSASAAEVLQRTHGGRGVVPDVLEHGVAGAGDPAGADPVHGHERHPGPLRVLCPAAWFPQKGVELLREVMARTGPAVEWHVLGHGSQALGPEAVVHGEYRRERLPALVDVLDPDLVGFFSIWAETYAYTLSEAWMLGRPVLATDIGALGDRVRRHGGGVLVPVDDAAAVAATVLRVAADVRAGGRRALPAAPHRGVRDLVTAGEDYRDLYRRVSGRARPDSVVGYVAAGGGPTGRRAARQALLGGPLASSALRRVVPGDVLGGHDTSALAAVVLPPGPSDVATDALVEVLARRGTPVVRAPAAPA